MSVHNEHQSHEHEHEPVPGEFVNPDLEVDESVAPRPEEEVADALRTDENLDDDDQSGA